jgi:uncharacterized protein (TIGR03067 family)
MFRYTSVALFLSLGIVSLGLSEQPETKEKVKTLTKRDESILAELSKFQGTWGIVSQEMNGKPVPESDLKGRTLFFGAEVCILRRGNEILQVSVLKIDPTKTPKTVNAMVTKGLYQGETMLGIFEFEGENLKVCYDVEGVNRPTEFKTSSGENRFLAIYKRVPPPSDEQDDLVGKYESVSVEIDGKEHKSDAEITRQGDAYMVRYLKGKDVAYIGIGLRKGNFFSVCWANRGEIGVSMYRIEKDGKLLGEYTQLGSIGVVNKENLIRKANQSSNQSNANKPMK